VGEGWGQNEKNFFRLHDHGCEASLSLSSSELPILDVESEKIFFGPDDAAERAVVLLVEKGRYERTKYGKGARDSVEAAMAEGWTGQECLECVEGWLSAMESGQFDWVKDVGYVAFALREHRKAPSPKKPKETETVTAKCCHVVYRNLVCPECGKCIKCCDCNQEEDQE
jgi:hypothetical protein